MLAVVDMQSGAVLARVEQPSPFCPNIAVTPDGEEVWYTLKDTGRVGVLRASPPFDALATLDTGPITNHVNFAGNAQGRFAYVSVGGLDQVKVYRRGPPNGPELVATIPTGDLPHGIWPSGDGSRVYVALENGGAVQVIDTASNRVTATIPVGQTSQALVYVPGAVPKGPGTQNLVPLGEAAQAVHLHLVPAGGASQNARATVAVNSLGPTDLLQVAASGLTPGKAYELLLEEGGTAPGARGQVLASFTANADGAAIAQFIGPLRKVLTAPAPPGAPAQQRHLLVVREAGSGRVLLVQAPP
jgi:YVTN family beta-propeller protein